MTSTHPGAARARFTLERTFVATLDEAWALWTTPDGIEAWWGPDGFEVKVRRLELRPGGALDYVMTAVAPEQVAFMQRANMPLSTETRVTYREVVPPRRLVFFTRADFIPGVEPYDVETVLELEAQGDRVRLVLSFDAMHDAHWTRMQKLGNESQLDRLEALLAKRHAPKEG